MKFFLIYIFFIFVLPSCYRDHLYVQHEKIDVSYLASFHVNTPDPKQKNPPKGQKISIAWDFPLSIYKEKLNLILTVRFWDNKQQTFCYPIERKRGYISYKFQDATKDRSKKILTYKVDVFNEDKVLVSKWKHQFWKERIDINEDIAEQDIINDFQVF